MIYLSFNISNPYTNRFKSLIYRQWKLAKNKSIDMEIIETNNIIVLSFSYSIRTSHAGIMMAFGILGYEMILEISDNRHWNYTTNTWEI